MSGLTCFTELNVLVLCVADRTDHSAALLGNHTNFAGRKTDLSETVLLSHKLSGSACCSNELSALAGIHLYAADNCTYRDRGNRKNVAVKDICIRAALNLVTYLEALGSEDVGLNTVNILNECQVSCSVRIVLDCLDCSRNSYSVTLPIDYSELCTVTAADMANRDTAIRVTAACLLP